MLTKSTWVGGLLLLIFLVVEPLHATSVRPVNLPEMVQLADRVFYGVCIGSEEIVDAATGLPITEYRFRVVRAVKGVEDEQLISIRQLSGAPGLGLAIADLPSYRKGSRVLLFLHGDSRLGLTSPVGIIQGVFDPVELADGTVGFRNAARNRNLGYGLGETQAAERGLGRAELSRLQSGVPLRLGELVEMVRQIESVEQNREVIE